MSENIASLAKEHHAFYEVLPYHIVLQEKHAGLPDTHRTIQIGFDVDVYGLNIKSDLAFPGADPDYTRGCTGLEKIAEEVSRRVGGSCFVEVISFPETIVFDNRHFNTVEGLIKIRISHRRGFDRPAGEAEQNALTEVLKQLHGLGIARR